MSTLKQAVRQYLIDDVLMGASGADFADGDSFMAMQLLDSTGFLELIAWLEERHGIAIADEEMVPENLDSLDAIEAFVTRKLAA